MRDEFMNRGTGAGRGDTGESGLALTVDRIVKDIESFKWERTAEPVWAARVEVASVYFRKRTDGRGASGAAGRAA